MSFEEVTIEDCRLILGDCREVLPLLPKVDLILTDPPYGIGFRYDGDFVDSDSEYADLLRPLAGMPLALLQYPEEMMRLVCPVLGAPQECLIWTYNSNLPRQSRIWGFWNVHVDFSLVKVSAKNINCAKVKDPLVTSYDWISDVQQVKGNALEKTEHPCQLPIRIVERVIGITDPATICDPFMGSGTTGVACVNLGRKFIGIERERKYFDIACRRIEQAYAQPRLFEENPTQQMQEALL